MSNMLQPVKITTTHKTLWVTCFVFCCYHFNQRYKYFPIIKLACSFKSKLTCSKW